MREMFNYFTRGNSTETQHTTLKAVSALSAALSRFAFQPCPPSGHSLAGWLACSLVGRRPHRGQPREGKTVGAAIKINYTKPSPGTGLGWVGKVSPAKPQLAALKLVRRRGRSLQLSKYCFIIFPHPARGETVAWPVTAQLAACLPSISQQVFC
uniref:Uncharacterized protein n=1 Tax=Anopheles culicifacies TaxID=139723 RepID=A0A182MWG3_9DIPT